MNRAVYIRKFICCFILLVFALSISPKRYLHSLFASHTDCRSSQAEGNQQQLSVSGYNCDNDNTVVNSVFTGLPDVTELPYNFHYKAYSTLKVLPVTSAKVFSSLRGPPAC